MKITLIGAGSVVFAKTLVGDILQFPEFNDITICLMDIDPKRLEVADSMMKKLVAKLGSKARIESTLDRTEAIRNAKYVICTIQVGGYKPGTTTDFEIPKKYGLEQTIGDTLGIGGIFRGLRTIPEIVKIAEDIEQVAHPECLFLNYSNPMAMNCWAVESAVGIPHVGLCHSVFGTARMLSNHVNIDFNDVSYTVAGINHMAFFLKFQYRGQDAYPLLFKALNDPSRKFERVRYEMMRRTGYFVTESSEHQSEYVPYFIHHGEKVINEFNIPIDEYLRRCESIIATWEETEQNLLGKEGDIAIKPQSHEYGSYIIHSIETNTLRTIYGNIPNYGIIDNLEQGCCVEVPCQVDQTGLSPVRIGDLPPQLAALCMTNVNPQRLTVEAALTNKREHIYHAAMMDPHTSATLTLDQIWSMCDELIEAHQKNGLLQEFIPTAKNSGRSAKGIEDRVIAKLEANEYDPSEGASNNITLKVENPNTSPCSLNLKLATDSQSIQLEQEQINIEVEANSTYEEVISTSNLQNVTKPQPIHLTDENPNVLAIGSKLIPRNRIPLNDKGEAHFELELSGFSSAEGFVKREGAHLVFDMKIHDSDIKPNERKPWEGSCVELFITTPENKDRQKQFFVIPQKSGDFQIREASKEPNSNAEVIASRVTEMYYTFQLRIPESETNTEASNCILLDSLITLNALGDAHSGGRCALNGKFNSSQTSGHYSMVSFS